MVKVFSPLSEALDLVSEAASHTEDAMRRIDKFKKLLEVQESLGGGERFNFNGAFQNLFNLFVLAIKTS